MKKKSIIFCLLIISGVASINAQIGYQVSLLNSATGEPRANETVGVTIEITNSEGAVVCQESTSATTNEFGVLSLQVGSSNTFANMDWSKLPLYISATVDGVMVGRSQILTVPVAEAAKNLVNVAPELICKTWTYSYTSGGDNYTYTYRLTLTENKTYTFSINGAAYGGGEYIVQGNQILICNTSGYGYYLPSSFTYNKGKLYGTIVGDILGNVEFH